MDILMKHALECVIQHLEEIRILRENRGETVGQIYASVSPGYLSFVICVRIINEFEIQLPNTCLSCMKLLNSAVVYNQLLSSQSYFHFYKFYVCCSFGGQSPQQICIAPPTSFSTFLCSIVLHIFLSSFEIQVAKSHYQSGSRFTFFAFCSNG